MAEWHALAVEVGGMLKDRGETVAVVNGLQMMIRV